MEEINNISESFNEEAIKEESCKYISVMFEDKLNSTLEAPKFYGRKYNYKTHQNLIEGQVIRVPVGYSGATSNAVVINPDVDPSTIDFDLSLIKEV